MIAESMPGIFLFPEDIPKNYSDYFLCTAEEYAEKYSFREGKNCVCYTFYRHELCWVDFFSYFYTNMIRFCPVYEHLVLNEDALREILLRELELEWQIPLRRLSFENCYKFALKNKADNLLCDLLRFAKNQIPFSDVFKTYHDLFYRKFPLLRGTKSLKEFPVVLSEPMPIDDEDQTSPVVNEIFLEHGIMRLFNAPPEGFLSYVDLINRVYPVSKEPEDTEIEPFLQLDWLTISELLDIVAEQYPQTALNLRASVFNWEWSDYANEKRLNTREFFGGQSKLTADQRKFLTEHKNLQNILNPKELLSELRDLAYQIESAQLSEQTLEAILFDISEVIL